MKIRFLKRRSKAIYLYLYEYRILESCGQKGNSEKENIQFELEKFSTSGDKFSVFFCYIKISNRKLKNIGRPFKNGSNIPKTIIMGRKDEDVN